MIPGMGRSPGEGNSYPIQYSCLGNSMDREVWWSIAQEVAKSWSELLFPSLDIFLTQRLNQCLLHWITCGCWSWTIKKAEHQRIDAFELWCWRRLLRVPWTSKRSNQSILKEVSPEYSLEGLILKLMLQYFGHLMQRTDSLEKPLMVGKIESRRRRRRQRYH